MEVLRCEGGTIAPGPAIAAAVEDALAAIGPVFVNQLPLLPERVRRLADAAHAAAGGAGTDDREVEP